MRTVTITRHHVKDRQFDNINDDALAAAIRQQIPELKPVKVMADHFTTQDGHNIRFDDSDNGYCRKTFRALKNRERKSISVEIDG